MKKIKYKKSLILIATFGLVAIISIFPSALAWSVTVVPDDIINTYGKQTGTLEDIQTEDDDYVQWVGVRVALVQYKILTRIYFPVPSSVGANNKLEWEFQFSGGNVLDVKIYYTDGTYDRYLEGSTGWKTVIYDLDAYKIVDYVKLFNHEWWNAGWFRIDYMEVNYKD